MRMLDERSEECKAADERRRREDEERCDRAENHVRRIRRQLWSAGIPWQPMSSCPFRELEDAWGEPTTLLVTDGESIAIAKVSRRCGRPVRCVEEPRMVLTDEGLSYRGGRYEEIDAPEWWFEWELEDLLERDVYLCGEPSGKPEVDFIATHWLLLPGPLEAES